MGYITSIGTATPIHRLSQNAVAEFMTRAMQANSVDARKLKTIFKATGIDTRYSVIDDYGRSSGFEFYENTPDMQPFPSTRQRLELYRKHALAISLEAVQRCLDQRKDIRKDTITHLVVVSCTGMYAPGLDIDIVKSAGLYSGIERTCINFMGCYAAFNALKIADQACARHRHAKVLIVCAELCTIHFQKEFTEDNVLANALFGDGAAAVLVESHPQEGINLRMESFHCDLATEGEHDMTWSIGDFGFEMRLSSYVPEIIRQGIRRLTRSLLSRIKDGISHIDYYAIHPGGKKILTAIENELGITREQNEAAYRVLRSYGNMSSPTVLFVINEIFRQLKPSENGKQILSFAFGPGLTLESMILRIQFC